MKRLAGKIFCLFTTFVFITSCSDSDSNNITNPEPNTSIKYLNKITQDSNTYSAFYYSNEKLTKYESYSNSVLNISIDLNYNGFDKPQSETYISTLGNADNKKYYHYNENSRLDSMTYSIKTGSDYSPVGYVKYYYNEIGQLIKTEQFLSNNNFMVGYEFSYDSNGNMIEVKEFRYNRNVYSITTMTYDDKVNPWYNLKDYFLYNVSVSRNNMVSSEEVFTDNIEENNQSIISYVYDDEGYPISSEIQYISESNNSVITKFYEYE